MEWHFERNLNTWRFDARIASTGTQRGSKYVLDFLHIFVVNQTSQPVIYLFYRDLLRLDYSLCTCQPARKKSILPHLMVREI